MASYNKYDEPMKKKKPTPESVLARKRKIQDKTKRNRKTRYDKREFK